MDRNRRKQIDALFDRMLDIEPSHRAEALATSCVGDDELRREVELLLHKADQADKINLQSVINGAIGQVIKQPSVLKPGQKIGHYTVKSQIGRGGMGQVWLAKDDRLGRDVAIKILPPEFAADPERISRFKLEAYAVGRLNHSNIVTVHDTDKIAGLGGELHFIVTEFIKGKTLRALMAESNLTWRDAVMVAAQVASALNAAHSVKIIHRDIKPENIMALADKHVKVLDFGIAKLTELRNADFGLRNKEIENAPVESVSDIPQSATRNPQLTVSGVLLGTAKYMSPEQARGEELDARTDIFSFGIVLYEMVAGWHPYPDMTDEQIIAELKSDEEIPPVSGIKANIPAALDRLIAKAIRKNREQRYASVSEMQIDIEHLKSLIRLSSEKREKRRLREQNADQLLTQYVVFHETDPTTRIPLGALLGVLRFADLKRGKLERKLIRQSLINGMITKGWWVLLIAIVTLAFAAWQSVAESWREQQLRDGHQLMATRRAVFSPDGRLLVSVGEDKQVIVWDFVSRQRLATLTDHEDRVTTVEFSPDGKWFVTAAADGNIFVWDADRLTKVAVLPVQRGVVRAVAFSADGKVLVTPTDADQKNVWEVGSWKKIRAVNTPHYRYGQFLLSPEGRWMMTPHGDVCDLLNEGCLIDRRPPFWSGITPFAKNLRSPFWSWAALSPDGRRMISIDAAGFVAFSSVTQFEIPEGRKLLGSHRLHNSSGRAVAYSPNGKQAASGAEDIVLWNVATQEKVVRFKHQANVSSLAFSPDGRWLVSTHRDGAILVWDTEAKELMADFTGHSEMVEAVAFKQDGKQIASGSADGSVVIWNVEQGNKQAVLLWHTSRVNAVAFSADGNSLVSNDLDGNLAMWDVAERRLRWANKIAKRIPSEASYCAAISPDGQWLATSYGVYECASGRLVCDFRTESATSPIGVVPQSSEVRDVEFSADGRLLVSITSRGEIAIRRVGQWQIMEYQKVNSAHLVSLSLFSNGKQMVTGEDEGLIRFWRTNPLRQVSTLDAKSGRILSVACSPDGSEVVSAGDDKMIALWNVSSRKQITTIGLHSAPVYAVAFSPDGKQIVSGGHDHSVRLYTRHRSVWGWPLD